MRKQINLKVLKKEDTDQNLWNVSKTLGIPSKILGNLSKILNRIKRKWIYNFGKSIKKKRKLLKIWIQRDFRKIRRNRGNASISNLIGFRLFLIRFRVEAFYVAEMNITSVGKNIFRELGEGGTTWY